MHVLPISEKLPLIFALARTSDLIILQNCLTEFKIVSFLTSEEMLYSTIIITYMVIKNIIITYNNYYFYQLNFQTLQLHFKHYNHG